MPPDEYDALFTPARPRDRLRATAERIGVDPAIADDFANIIALESGNSHYDRRGRVKVSPPDPRTGERAVGLTQIKPSTARGVGVSDPFNEDANLEAGLKYFAQGGPDPVARRIHYFGGPGAARSYRRTGRIPKGGDVLGTTFEQYVQRTRPAQQPPASPYDALFNQPSEQIPPQIDETRAIPANPPVSARPSAPSKSRPTFSGSGRAFGEPVSDEQRKAIEAGVRDFERRKRPQRPLSIGELRQLDEQRLRKPQLSPAEMRQQDEQRVGRLQRIRQQVQSEQAAAAEALRRNPASAQARLYDPLLNPDDEALRRYSDPTQGRSPQELQAAEQAERERQQRVSKMSTGQYLAQIPKSAGLALTDTVSSGLKSIAVLAKKTDLFNEYKGKDASDLATFRAGEWVQQNARELLKSNPDLERDFIVGQSPQAVGQAISFLLGGLATKAPRLTVAILGSGMTASSAYEEVKANGGTEDEAINAGLLSGAILGPSELIGTRGLMKAVKGAPQEQVLRSALSTALREGRKDVIENALQEVGQEYAQGKITGISRSDWQLLDAGLLGAIGGTVTTPVTLVARRGQRGSQSEIQPPVEAEREAVESVSVTEGQERGDLPVEPIDRPASEAPAQPARYYHRDFGEVVESPNQSGVGKRRVRVVDASGDEHIIKRANLSGVGNARAVPVRTRAVVTPLGAEPASATGAVLKGDTALLTSERNAPSLLGGVERSVIDTGQDLKILDPVIAALPVDVVDFFGGKQRATKMLLHDPTMLADTLSAAPENAVSRAFSGLSDALARRRAELKASHPTRATRDEVAALDAVTRNLGEVVRSSGSLRSAVVLPEEAVSTGVAAPRAEAARLSTERSGRVGTSAELTGLRNRHTGNIAQEVGNQSAVVTERRTPARMKDADWLDLTPEEQARVRQEVDLEQQSPVEPAPAQVDILSEPTVTESVTKPAVEPSTNPSVTVKEVTRPARPKTPEPSTSARKSQLAADRAELDLPELPPAQRKSWQQSLSEAKPDQAQRLADEALNAPRALNDSETASLVVRAQQVKNEHAAKLAQIAKAKSDTLPQLRAELETIEREFDSLTRAAKSSGTEKGRSLAAQKLTINKDYDLVSFVSRAKAAKGRDLTSAERQRYESMAQQIAKLEAELATANDKLAQKRLNRDIERVSRQRRRSETKESLDAEFAQLRTQLTQARAEARNVQAAGLAALDPEGKITPLIARMAKNRIKAGIKSAEALITEVYETVKDYGWSKENVASVIRETIRESDDVISRWDKRRQAQLIKREAEFTRRIEQRDFTQALPRERPIYNRETARLENQVNELKARFESDLRRSQRGPLGTAWEVGVNIATIPKTLKSMGDISALLRQGGYYSMTHPILSARAARDMFRAFSEVGFKNVEHEIKTHPDFQLAKRSGVEFTGVDKESVPLAQREEAYLSNFISKLPIAKQSEQTFVAFLDSQRMQVFERLAQELRDRGLSPERHPNEYRAIAKLINIGTGRGSLGRRGNQIAPALNTLMFSPRLLASRVQLLNNMLNPVAIQRMPPAARSRMIKDNVKFAGTIATVLGLAVAAGAKVALDPDDSDFLKIRIGNSRYDILTGIQQPLRFMWRMARALKADITQDETYAGEEKAPLVKRFARSKASPVAGVVTDYFTGEDFRGRKFNLTQGVIDLLVPLYADDFYEAMKEDNVGPAGAAIRTSPSLVGIGANTYKDAPEKPITHAEKLARKFLSKKLPDEAREEAQIELDQKKADLRARSRKGEDVRGEVEKLRGQVTAQQAKRIVEARGRTRLQEDFTRLSLDEAATVYSVATREEQRLLRPMLESKVGNFSELPESKRDPVKRKLIALGIAPSSGRPSRPARPERGSRR